MVSPISKLVVLSVKAVDVVLLDELLEAAEQLLEHETARLDEELDDELATLLGALEELDIGAAELELLPGDEPPHAVNNKNEK